MRLGCHLSIAKGLDRAAQEATALGANTFQFFTRNPRGGKARTFGEQEIAAWQAVRRKYDLYPVVAHLPYTVNMAAPDERPYAFAKMVVAEDLERMEAIGAEYLVVHPGSHVSAGKEAGIRRIVNCLEETFLTHGGACKLLLEAMAGQGTEIGTLADIAEIMDALGRPERLGICLDTCHLTGAGFNFLQREEMERLLAEVDRLMGIDRIGAVHLNDSKFPPGSKKDRHARIGAGYLGREGMLNFITHPALAGLPFILETPVDDYSEYGEEIALLLEWVGEKGNNTE
ncbi:MAG: deoxyribonuclease IV [Firmicutes bacterium]|nr:deoxyribonuclease IV [Bacillota bacterium]